MRSLTRIGFLVVVLCLPAASALAVDVFVNGERVTGATNLTFQNPSSVRIDARGDVHIDAPGYRVQSLPAPGGGPGATASPGPAAPMPGKRYFLVTDTNAPGQVQYDVDVVVNGQLVRHVEDSEGQVIVDVTDRLRPGRNTVSVRATKDLAGGRRSASNGHVLRVIVGEGTANQSGHVSVTNPQVVFVVDASQTAPVSRDYTLSVE